MQQHQVKAGKETGKAANNPAVKDDETKPDTTNNKQPGTHPDRKKLKQGHPTEKHPEYNRATNNTPCTTRENKNKSQWRGVTPETPTKKGQDPREH